MKNLFVFLFACCVQAVSAHIAFIADSGKGCHMKCHMALWHKWHKLHI